MRSVIAAIGLLISAARGALAQHSPRWLRGATCYEVFVRSFYDSDGDGIGDLKGLTAKLDYIDDGNARRGRSLGARCVWLMPIVESPSYHGYDATDYYHVAKAYGTNEDFKQFVAAAHRRGIHVLVDMVLNHTSSQHPWFQAALHDTASPYRSWYRWSRTKPDQKGPWARKSGTSRRCATSTTTRCSGVECRISTTRHPPSAPRRKRSRASG